MFKNFKHLLFFLLLIFAVSNVCMVGAWAYGEAQVRISLKKDVSPGFVKDIDTVIGSVSKPVKKGKREYLLTIPDGAKIQDQYYYLFHNCPAIEKVDGLDARPQDETVLYPSFHDSPEAMGPEAANSLDAKVQPEPDTVPGELLIKFTNKAPKGIMKKVCRVYGIEEKEYLKEKGIYIVKIPIGSSTRSFRTILYLCPFVLSAEFNKIKNAGEKDE